MKRNRWLVIFMFYIPLIQTNRPSALRTELYGPYNALVRKVGPCAPHESVDYKNYTFVEVKLNALSKSEVRIQGAYWYEEDTYMDDTKVIEMFVWRNDQFKLLLKRMVTNSCHDLLFRPILQTYLGMNNDCLIKKGYHTVASFDMNEIIHMFVGDTIFYGKYMIRIDAANTKGRIGCLEAVYEFCPIEKLAKRRRKKIGK